MISREPLQLAAFARVLIPCLVLTLAACQPQTPEEQVDQSRSQYVVQLNSWFPREPEPVEPAVSEETAEDAASAADEEAAETATAAEAEGEGEGAEDAEAVEPEPEQPATVDIYFDLIVNFSGNSPLPGLTVDVSQADASGSEKKAWRHYLELPEHSKGSSKQVNFTTEGLEFAEGDQFSVVLEEYVAAEDRGEYREYGEAAAGAP
ncbi:MAG: hypothetical protein AAF725_12305 [Acidobacteriota bacterium]